MDSYNNLSIKNPSELVFGKAPHPLTTRRGLQIGAGKVYPELNFTLPPMSISESTFPEIKEMYRGIITDACKRACDLGCEGFVAEFETLPEMTATPRYAIELTSILNQVMEEFYTSDGLKTALRITPNDLREMRRPPKMRSGELLENMLETFEGCAEAGADFLAIESTGGKELHDSAVMSCDVTQAFFALAVLGCRDMDFLWDNIVRIAKKTGTIASGDTACAFGNTAMVLAEKKYIPRTFAAVIRVLSIVRSLVAYEKGAIGPGKDCGYENAFLKAITGFPMSMEGKTAACAHLSPLGNIASAYCDLWSNESVQNVKLLGGMAPTVYLEQLIYDCRLMDTATANGNAVTLRDLFVDSDASRDPQAYIFMPDNVIAISEAVVASAGHYSASKSAVLTAIDILRRGHENHDVNIPELELPYLDMIESAVSMYPDREESFIDEVTPLMDNSKYVAEDYDMPVCAEKQ